MRRIVDYLAPLGLLIVAVSQWMVRESKPLPGKPEIYLAVGGALVLAHLLLRWEDIAKAIGARQLRYGGNTAVLVLVVLGILVGVNWLVDRHTTRFDLTKNQRYSLSDQTKKVVQGLKEDVKITYFQRSVEMSYGQDRMKQYEAISPRVKVEFVDPLKNPARAREQEVTAVPTLVLEYAGKKERISNDTEQDVTNALIKVTRDKKKTVCFAEGEGEHDPEDSGDRGYSSAKAALAKSQYAVKKVLLLHEKEIPADCTELVLAGPAKDLLPQAVDPIRSYVKGGGKALVMLEPEIKETTPNLDALAKEWNLELSRDIVVDVSGMGQLFGTGAFTPIAAQYPPHEITKDLRGYATAFHEARSIEVGKGNVEGVFAQKLLETTQSSWAEADFPLKDRVEMNPPPAGKDRQGPISLGAAVTVRVAAPAPPPSPSPSPTPDEEKSEPPKPEGRVVVLGDSDFASNALLGFQGNQDFFLNSVAWLAQDPDLISIRPREPDDQKMFLTATQQRNVLYLSLILLPGLFVVLGVYSWWRRR
jgi:ABC-type uncharacterized transport system involved in gliding motility auxiliary subunit